MACGKSTLGPLLALSLALPFMDLDHEVEACAGKGVAALFQDLGEQGFRALERDTYRRVARGFHGVLALGGGLPCQPGMADEIAATGICLFLDVELDLLQRRLMEPGVARPLLHGLSQEGRTKAVEALLAERRPHYLRAGRRVTLGGEVGIPEQLDLLLAAVKGWSA